MLSCAQQLPGAFFGNIANLAYDVTGVVVMTGDGETMRVSSMLAS